jgi:hypothetical protein
MTTGTTTMARVTQIATGVAGSPYYLTGYFDFLTGTAQNAADAWRNLLSAGVSTYTAPLAFSPITEVSLINPVNGDLIGLTTVSVAAITFTGAGDPLPPSTSMLLRWRTGEYVDGREIRGRTNIPRMAEADNTAGVVTAATVTAWQARQATLLASSTAHHVVWSKKAHKWALTSAASTSNQWAVLRTRRD